MQNPRAIGLIWMPAPISPISAARSKMRTSKPA